VAPAALADAARELARTGRVRRRLTRAQWVVAGTLCASLAAAGALLIERFARLIHEGGLREGDTLFERTALAAAALFLAATFAAALVLERGPLSPRRRRTAIGLIAFVAWQLGTIGGPHFPTAQLAAFTLALVAGAAWAWLGRNVKPRSAAARRWLEVLAVLLISIAVAMWGLLLARP
jgi:MFS family permease